MYFVLIKKRGKLYIKILDGGKTWMVFTHGHAGVLSWFKLRFRSASFTGSSINYVGPILDFVHPLSSLVNSFI